MSNIHQQCDTLIVIFDEVFWCIHVNIIQNTLSLCFNKVIFVQLEVQCNVESQNWWFFFFFTLYVVFIFCLMYRYCNIKQWWCSYIENLLRDKVKCTHWYKKEKHKCFKFIQLCFEGLPVFACIQYNTCTNMLVQMYMYRYICWSCYKLLMFFFNNLIFFYCIYYFL